MAPGMNSAFHIVTSGWSDGQAPFPALSPVTYRRPMPTAGRHGNPDSDHRGGIGNRTSRSNSRVFKSEHRACSRNSRK